MANFVARITGADMYTAANWRVAGTDLGIPYLIENNNVGYIFGDTFSSAWPGPVPPEVAGSGADWRSPVALRSSSNPKTNTISFNSAYKLGGNGVAPELFHNGHWGQGLPGHNEITCIPNDGIYFPETGDHIISYMSIDNWNNTGAANWRSHYCDIAWSDDGNTFTRQNLRWHNGLDNQDVYQMWSMQRDGEYVYIISVKSGRQVSPIILQRVPWDKMFDQFAYQGWNATTQTWGGAWSAHLSPLIPQRAGVKIGEPSLRLICDNTTLPCTKVWVMSYLKPNSAAIVTRTAPAITGPWSAEKVQVSTTTQLVGGYGGFIHPYSDAGTNGLTLICSRWTKNFWGQSTAYHVEQYRGTV